MWTPAWFDALFMLLTSPATWVAVGIFVALLAVMLLRAAWRLACRVVGKGGA